METKTTLDIVNEGALVVRGETRFVSNTEEVLEKKDDSNLVNDHKINRRKSSNRKKPKPHNGLFKDGNNVGVKFGSGQPTNLGGRPAGGMSVMRQAMKHYEDHALVAAKYLTEKALDPFMDPKHQAVWFKELNSRILGATKGSAEDIINKLSEKLDGNMVLNRSALEATANADAEALVRELIKQGNLDKVVNKIMSEPEVKNEQ